MGRRVVAVGWRRTRAVCANAAAISANRSLSAFAKAGAGFAKAGGVSVRLRQGFGGHSYA